MRQVVQNYSTGELTVENVPAPICRRGCVVVRTAYSLVSAGTERMKVTQARMNLLAKARARPDKVRQVLATAQQIGVTATIRKVRERLDALTPLGYSLAGVVDEVGADSGAFRVGDRVACAGEGTACHAEFVCVPRNLCVPVPDTVELQDAAFATVGAIAMNGLRQAQVTLGDNVLVIGLGLVGLLGVQLLRAAGCRVLGMDVDAARLALARECGADAAWSRATDNLEERIRAATDGRGVDAVYVAASTRSADPLALAGRVLRDRGCVVVVGMVPLTADWEPYYRKELRVVLARSYGPGRYDPAYEQKGVDYPIGYVRWTERRNLAEFIRLVAAGQVAPRRLAPAVFPLEAAPEAYRQLRDEPGRHAIGLLFQYPRDPAPERRVEVPPARAQRPASGPRVGIGVIGPGNFATGTLIPALRRLPGVELRGICSARGLSGRSAARRHGFAYCTSEYETLLADDQIDAVVIATRHDTHAQLAADALRAGKQVFVEKPLALTQPQLDELLAAQRASGNLLMPGFNRRFSPLSRAVREFFAARTAPLVVTCRVNAGALAADSWYQDPDEGGWRIVSEGCHFIDLIQYLCDSSPVCVRAEMLGGGADPHDNCVVTLELADGSLGNLVYVAAGDPRYSKERIEVFGQGCSAAIDNFRTAEFWPGAEARPRRRRAPGKGHAEELAAFVRAVATGGPAPLPLVQAVRTTLAALAIPEALRTRGPVPVEEVCVAPAVDTERKPHASAR